jgi:predicted RNA methylase
MAASIQLALRSVRAKGVRGAASRLVRMYALRHERRRQTLSDREFDRERWVDTAAWVRVPELDTASPNRGFAVRYQPSSVAEFLHLMAKLPVDPSDFVLVDYGAGKGRVLILGAELGFRRVVGVEFAARLVGIARENLRRLGIGGDRAELVHADAAEFEPPGGPLVLYFFNPFGTEVLRPVLARVHASFERAARPLYLVLTGPPPLAELVEAEGFVPLDVERDGWRTRGVWSLTPS